MSFSNTDNIIDSREIIERLEELREEKEELELAVAEATEALEGARTDLSDALSDDENDDDLSRLENAVDEARSEVVDAKHALAEWIGENEEELETLETLNDEGENYSSDWMHGETLIHEDYFVEYCQELVSDIGDMPREIPSYIVIDWEATAENLKVDYTEIDFDGETFYIRSY